MERMTNGGVVERERKREKTIVKKRETEREKLVKKYGEKVERDRRRG